MNGKPFGMGSCLQQTKLLLSLTFFLLPNYILLLPSVCELQTCAVVRGCWRLLLAPAAHTRQHLLLLLTGGRWAVFYMDAAHDRHGAGR